MPGQLPYRLGPAHHYPRLGPTQQLVPREERGVHPGGDALLRGRFVGQPVVPRLQEATAAQVVEHQQAVFPAQGHQLLHAGAVDEAGHTEVAGVDLEQSGYLITHFKFKAFIEVDGKKLKNALEHVEETQIPALVGNSVPLMYKTFKNYKRKKKRTFSMPESFRVQTGGGGWSGVKGRVKTDPIDKGEFIETLSDFFNITQDNFADCYGATESPIACGGHYSKKYNDYLLHVYKDNARIVLRAVEDLERVKAVNEAGILEIITPYGVKTYAGVAVLLDDLVQVVDWNRCPDCGRENVIVFRHVGRLTPEIGKGCTSFTRLFPFEEEIK